MMTTIQLTNFECNEKVRKFKNLRLAFLIKFKGVKAERNNRTLDTFLLGGGSGGGESTHF